MKKQQITPEMIDENRKRWVMEDLDKLPPPNYFFEIGEEVSIGNLKNVIVVESLEGGKVYKIDYTSIENNYGRPIITEHVIDYRTWLDLRPLQKREGEELIKNKDLLLHYSQMELMSIVNKKYSSGLEMNPEYQRDYIWSAEDKYKLIDSIFNNIDIGKFVFIKNEWGEHPLNYMYEILDGKQRINAITEYFENRFSYNGLFFNELSRMEQSHFKSYPVSTAELARATREQKLRYFLMLNTSGKVMDAEHLKKIENMLDKDNGS